MEKSLINYLTVEEAAKKNYITAQMIQEMCDRNFIPYFHDLEGTQVNPEDIKNYLETKIFGIVGKIAREKRKKVLEELTGETPEETITA